MHDDLTELTLALNEAIAIQDRRIKDLESRLSGRIIPTGDDGYVVDKINYHLGVASGLRQANMLIGLVQA